MYYDLHIHSALSPCSDDEMTPNNIVNMAWIKELDLIAITDHNSMKQLNHLKAICENKIDFVYGVEIQSREEIHVLAYFLKDCAIDSVQDWLDTYLIAMPNDPNYYGNQLIFDAEDNIIAREERLLITSLDLDLKSIIDAIHKFNGIAVLAHVMSKKYSVTNVFRKIPQDLDYDGLEVVNADEIKELEKQFPNLKETVYFISSDAHQLVDISEAVQEMDETTFYGLWRKH